MGGKANCLCLRGIWETPKPRYREETKPVVKLPLVLVDDALAHGLVELGRRHLEGCLRLVGVAGVGGLAELADRGLELRLDRLVALGRHAVRLDPLELGLDVCHVLSAFSGVGMPLEGGSRASGPDVGTSVVDVRWVVLRCAHDLKRSRRPSGLRKTIADGNSLAHRTTWLRSDFLGAVCR